VHHNKPFRSLLGLLFILVIIATSCGGDDEADSGPSDAGGTSGGSVELEDQVVIAGPGGELGQAWKEALAPWADENGVEVMWVEGLGSDNAARVVATKNNPEIDLLSAALDSHYSAVGQDVFAPIDPEILTNLDNVPAAEVVDDNSAISVVTDGVGIWWNADEFESNGLTPPETWDDFWDLLEEPDLQDHVVLPAVDNGYMRAFVATQIDDPADPSPMFERLADVDDWIYEYARTPAAMHDLAVSGQAWLGITGFTRIVAMRAVDLPVDYVMPEPSPVVPHSWSFVKGAPHPNAAQALLNYLLSDEGQEAAAQTGLSPLKPGLGLDGVMSEEELSRLGSWDYQTVQEEAESWRTMFAEIVREPSGS
jgi:spermidine/putrescine-binding protein